MKQQELEVLVEEIIATYRKIQVLTDFHLNEIKRKLAKLLLDMTNAPRFVEWDDWIAELRRVYSGQVDFRAGY